MLIQSSIKLEKNSKDSVTFTALTKDIGLPSDIPEIVTFSSRHYNM